MAAAVLFDSGGVLIRPIGGRWNPRADFDPTVRAHHPADCLFVDDDPDLVAAAIALGYQGVALCRPGAPPAPAGVRSIPDLTALLDP